MLIKAFKVGLRKRLGDLAGLCQFASGSARPRLIILMYHAVTETGVEGDYEQVCVPRGLFRQHLSWIKEWSYPVLGLREAVDQLRAGPLPRSVIAITFDDGYLNIYTEAFPLLSEFGFPATIFLVPRPMTMATEPVFAIPKCGPLMTWDYARELTRYNMSFGSHSMTHRMLSRLATREIEWEVVQSKKTIEDELSLEITAFSYPFGGFGSFTPESDGIVRGAGYGTICTAIAGHNYRADDAFRLRRLRISWLDDCRRELQKQCSGSYNWYSLYQRVVA